MDQTPKQDLLNESLSVSSSVSSNLLSAAKWGRFVAITVLIFMTIMLVFLSFAGAQVTEALSKLIPGIPDGAVSIAFVIIAVFMLLAGLLLFVMLRAYNNIKSGIEMRNMEAFTNGWRYLKIYFTVYGVLTLLSILTIIQTLISLF